MWFLSLFLEGLNKCMQEISFFWHVSKCKFILNTTLHQRKKKSTPQPVCTHNSFMEYFIFLVFKTGVWCYLTVRIGATDQHELHQNGSLPLHTLTLADLIHSAQQWEHYIPLPPFTFSLLAKMSREKEREYWRRFLVSMKYPTELKMHKAFRVLSIRGALPGDIHALKIVNWKRKMRMLCIIHHF